MAGALQRLPPGFETSFDPAPLIETLACPALIIISDTTPGCRTTPAWRFCAELRATNPLRVPGGGHAPTIDKEGQSAVIAAYEDGLRAWLKERIADAGNTDARRQQRERRAEGRRRRPVCRYHAHHTPA